MHGERRANRAVDAAAHRDNNTAAPQLTTNLATDRRRDAMHRFCGIDAKHRAP